MIEKKINSIKFNDYDLINFTELKQEDLLQILLWRNHNEIRKWMFNNKVISIEEHLSFVEKLDGNNNKLYFLVKKKNDSIGVISFNSINFEQKSAYLGIYKNIETEYQGKILIESLIYVAFKILKLHTLKLEVIEDNMKAINFYNKFGFLQEGLLKEYVFRDEQWKNVLIMGLVNKND